MPVPCECRPCVCKCRTRAALILVSVTKADFMLAVLNKGCFMYASAVKMLCMTAAFMPTDTVHAAYRLPNAMEMPERKQMPFPCAEHAAMIAGTMPRLHCGKQKMLQNIFFLSFRAIIHILLNIIWYSVS